MPSLPSTNKTFALFVKNYAKKDTKVLWSCDQLSLISGLCFIDFYHEYRQMSLFSIFSVNFIQLSQVNFELFWRRYSLFTQPNLYLCLLIFTRNRPFIFIKKGFELIGKKVPSQEISSLILECNEHQSKFGNFHYFLNVFNNKESQAIWNKSYLK